MVTKDFWKGKRVLVTGHTGFKGSWLCLWLQILGAEVTGYSLPPPTDPNLYSLAKVDDGMTSTIGDILDSHLLFETIRSHRPEIIFHLAAQSLVLESFRNPRLTYATNIMGTIHLFEAVRLTNSVKVLINVTSDKCYENRDWPWGYRENDSIGGHDPYSSSKGCVELITSAYRHSFFGRSNPNGTPISLASVRAGNVIGGGDWAKDRLIPDTMRSLLKGEKVDIRNPNAVRPWQHVLEPLRGYLMVAEKCFLDGDDYAEGWNFGPAEHESRPASWIVERITELWGNGACWSPIKNLQPHEAQMLRLDSSKAKQRLGWLPLLEIAQALDWLVDWYKAFQSNLPSIPEITKSQITQYSTMASK